nr:HAMP domain-containing histidine kinase [Bacilli bacterium]
MKKINRIIIILIILLIPIVLYSVYKISEYKEYNKNYNNKINYIIDYVKTNTSLSDDDILKMINNNELNHNLIDKYGYNISNIGIINNNVSYTKYFIIEISILLGTIILFMAFYLYDNYKKKKELDDIIKLIDNINHHNYDTQIDSMSEDELSILKSEIYKTTIMLRSIADNSIKDKENLKKGLEDISHQLKTPLTSIMINLDNILDNPNMDDTTRNSFVKKIKKETYNIKNLVTSLLKLSEFDVNTIEFIRKDIKVKELIDESIEKVSSLADLKNIKINIDCNKTDTLYCDKMWEVEAISNIIKNALEHSNIDSVIDIEYSDNKVYKKILIRNYGSTISEEDQKHLFERFYKGSNSNSDSVGIGLSLSRNIINMDNGNIYVESGNNKTEFIIKYFKKI